MSLTTFIADDPDVRDRLRLEFPKVAPPPSLPTLAPPLSTRYSLVGTAFDYLLRFYLQRLNPSAISRSWIAEYAISHPLSPLLIDPVIDAKSGKVISYTPTPLTTLAQSILAEAKAHVAQYLSMGNVNQELLRSALLLAQLDPVFRRRAVDQDLGTVHTEDIADLRALISIVPSDPFLANHVCLLNPTFGQASSLVGGADADFLVDETIIDVKTTKKLEIRRTYFDQLVGYVILHHIGGIGGITPRLPINMAGIYFARHAYLYAINLAAYIKTDKFYALVDWFKQKAEVRHSQHAA